jgi:hypothetical protein
MHACKVLWKVKFQSSIAKMPRTCWGASNYRNVGLVAYREGDKPKTFHEVRGRKFFNYTSNLYVGASDKSRGFRLVQELDDPVRCERLAAKLNRECYQHPTDDLVGCGG